MGSISAMCSIARVLEQHGAEIVEQVRPCPPGTVLTFVESVLENNVYGIGVQHRFRQEDGSEVYVSGEAVDIDALAEEFPDCDVGY